MIRFCFYLFAAALLLGPAAWAEGAGIAMHGAPKYAAGFDHLDYVNPDAPKGGTLRQGVTGGFDNLNRFALSGRPAAGLHLLYDSLMRRVWDEPFSLYPLIAERVSMPPDRASVSFTLDPRAQFHDGSPITVDDLLWTFRTLRDESRPNFRNAYSQVESVEKSGPRRVTFRLKPSATREIPLILGMMPVLPRADWQGRDIAATRLDPPLGSGPYRIAEAEPGRRIVYERVADYWAGALPVNRGHYNFDRLVFDNYRDDGVALEAFKAGAFDLRRERDPIRWTQAYDFAPERTVTVEAVSHGRPEWARGLIFNMRRPPFDDRRVRRALILALDFEWINRTLYAGVYRRIASTLPNAALAHAGPPEKAALALLTPWREALPNAVFERAYEPPRTDGSGPRGHRRNLRRAAALLDRAGLKVGESGKRRWGGKSFGFEILLNDPADKRLALTYARSLERLGITVAVRVVDSAQYRARLNRFDFDMTVNRWISTLSPGIEQTYYWGCEAARQEGSRNYSGLCNPAVDALAQAVAGAETRAALETAMSALDRAVMWSLPMVPLGYVGKDWIAYRAPIRRPSVTPLYGIVLETWWAEGSAAR